jgi:hypothetical protein
VERGRVKGRFVIRLLLAADAAWLVFTVSRLLLSGAVWLMVLPDMVPPILLAVVPVVFLAAVGLVRLGRAPISRLAALGTAGAALAALAIGFPQSGLNLAALSSPAKPPTSAVRVMVWDTLGWDTDKNQAAFSRYLGGQQADLYLFQEYITMRDGQPQPVDDSAQLRRLFPGYYFATAGALLTVSRYPIAASRVVSAPLPSPYASWAAFSNDRVLRTDLRIGDRVLSVYNVYLADLFSTAPSPFSPAFYSTVHQFFDQREADLAALHDDIEHNPDPVLIGGVLNVLPGVGELHWLNGLSDAASTSRSLYPTSLRIGFLTAWRVDWAFTSPSVRTYSYDLANSHGLSTHSAQELTISP